MSLGTKVRQMTRKNTATVVEVADMGDGLRRVVTTIAETDIDYTPGQAVGLIVDPDGDSMKDRWRHYTVRRYDRASGHLEFLLTRHDPSTPGGRWIDSLTPGETFTFMGPGGKPTVDPGASHYVFVGDRTSLASIGAMVDALGNEPQTIEIVVATPDPSQASFATEFAHDVTWVPAASADDARSGLLEALPESIPSGARAYVTGELQMMRQVRDRLGQLGVPRRAIGTHAHWTPGRRGM